MGMVTEGNLMAQLLKKRVKATDPVSKVRQAFEHCPLRSAPLFRPSCTPPCLPPNTYTTQVLYKSFKQVSADASLGRVSRLLDKEPFVLVVSEQRCYSDQNEVVVKHHIFSIVTRIDLLNYIMSAAPNHNDVPKHAKEAAV
jgi:cystathionine beta-synthase